VVEDTRVCVCVSERGSNVRVTMDVVCVCVCVCVCLCVGVCYLCVGPVLLVAWQPSLTAQPLQHQI